MNGIALTVMTSQLPKLFGFSTDAPAAISFAQVLRAHPGLLLAVFAATIVIGILNLDATASAKVLGPLPQGLPSFTLPMINFGQLDEVIIGGYAGRHRGVRGHERIVAHVRRKNTHAG